MSAVVEQEVIVDEWHGLYRESWKGVIVDEAFAHPAKFSRALIQKIYEHVIEEGWTNKGDSVVDPFGGVALGAFPAMQHGLRWIGCELEEKFVALGNQNIALWNERYSRMPHWGTARLLQGDSRKLIEILSAAECCVSSPPFIGTTQGTSGSLTEITQRFHSDPRNAGKKGYRASRKTKPDFTSNADTYGCSEGQLGAMREGDHALVISSPPYAGSQVNPGNVGNATESRWGSGESLTPHDLDGYGSSSGQLGKLPPGDHAIAITSPPYNPPMSQDHNGTRGGQRGTTPSEKGAFVKYGNSEGQLEGMSMEGYDIAISSPPYEGSISDSREGDSHRARKAERFANGEFECTRPDIFSSEKNIGARGMWGGKYSMDPENVGNQRGETFWSASRLILEQLHQVIVPSGHAVFVVKSFVRDKKIVDFPAQWAQLCEAVGFRLLHDHYALLTEHYGTQGGFDGDKKLSVERKSFFRRLAESKGSPRIDYENVLCFERTD